MAMEGIEILLSAQLCVAQRALEKRIPTFVSRTSSYTLNMHKCLYKQIKGRKDLIGSLGLLPAFINVDASTKILHTERDATYTMISVPRQELQDIGVNFQFKITKDKSLFLKMNAPTTFAYSAFFLTHRQNYINGSNNINISSYGNQRLFYSARKSIGRINC